MGPVWLPGFELFYGCAAFLEEDTVAAVGTPDVNVDFHLLFAPGALVGTCHYGYRLRGLFFNSAGAVDCTKGYAEGGGLRLVCAAGKLVPALAAFPDIGALAADAFHVAFRAAVGCL